MTRPTRDQPRLEPSLVDMPRNQFDWPLDTARWPDRDLLPGIDLGIADHPEWQGQCRERIVWADLSILITGAAGSGRSSVASSVLNQCLVSTPGWMAVIVDPTTQAPDHWVKIAAGDGAWIVTGALDDAMTRLIEQLEVLQVEVDPERRVIVVLERLDLISTYLSDEETRRLAALIAGGPRRGIHFTATADVRTTLDAAFRRAFVRSFEFVSGLDGILRNSERDYVVRTLNFDVPSVAAPLNDSLALGPVGNAKASRLAQDLPDGAVLLGMDDTRHKAVALSVDQPFVIFGGQAADRHRTIAALCGSLAATSVRTGILGDDLQVEGTVDIMSALMTTYPSGRMLGELALGEAIVSLSVWREIDVLVIPSMDRLERWLPSLLASNGWDRAWVAGQVHLLPQSLRALVDSHSISAWGGYRMASFTNDRYFGGAHLINRANYVYISPRPAILMGSDYGEARGLIAAAPNRRYTDSRAVAVLDGERIELSNLVGY